MDAVYEWDMNLFKSIHHDLHRSWLDPIFWVVSTTGLGWVQAILILLMLKWRDTRYFVLPCLLALFVSGVPVAQAIKINLYRERPSNLLASLPQEDVYLAPSFPSGHTITSVAIATMLFLLTRGKRTSWIGWASIGWALLVGFSRIYRGIHWPTDIIGAVFGGMFSAGLVYLILGLLGRLTHLDEPAASLSGQESGGDGS